MNKFYFFVIFLLAGCASNPTNVVEAPSDPKIVEMQLLLEAEIFAYSGDIQNSANTYHRLAMQTASEEIFNKSFMMLTLSKDYDKAKEVVDRWRSFYKNRDSDKAQIINEMLSQEYEQSLESMDTYTSSYKEEIYNMILSFLSEMTESEKIWFYDELKTRYNAGNVFVENALILLGANKINVLLKEQNLADSQIEMDFLLDVLEKNNKKPNYLSQKQAILSTYLDIDMTIDPDIDAKKYYKFIHENEKMSAFYVKLAVNLSLFPDKEKIALIEKLLMIVAKDKNVDENFYFKIEGVELAKELRLYKVLDVYSTTKVAGSKETYLKNLALFFTPKGKPSVAELRKLVNKDYILGGILALEYLVATDNVKETKNQLDILVEKFPENRDLIYAEYFNQLQKYGKWSKIISEASFEIDKKKSWDEYTEHLYLSRAIAYSKQKNDSRMEKDFQTMLKNNPESISALNGWGYMLVEKNENLAEAEDMLSEALQLAPTNVGVLDSVGWLAYRQDRMEEATTILLKCFRVNVENEIAYHLAESYVSSGEIEKAKKIAYRIWLDNPKYEYLDVLQKNIEEKEKLQKEKNNKE